MVDKKLSEFSAVQPSDVSDLVVLYLDGNNSTKNGRLSFNAVVSMLALLAGDNTFGGDNTFSGDTVFEGNTTFNTPINGTASRATADANGNNISSTYATKTELQQKSSFKLFHHDWFDYILNDQSWLRADTFSWQDGTVYTNAYNHLVADYQGGTSQTETVGSYTITYVLATDGHKITTDETTVANIYSESGVAWYYILDTTNQRFKLPRENPEREVLVQETKVFGDGNSLMLSNGSSLGNLAGSTGTTPQRFAMTTSDLNAVPGTQVGGSGNYTQIGAVFVGIPTREELEQGSITRTSGIIADLSSVSGVYKGKKYLYFYIGQFSQSATEQTAGLNSELFNGKADIEALNNKIQQVSTLPVNPLNGVLYVIPE